MATDRGWIKVHRKLKNNAVFTKPNYLSVWIYLLLNAQHEPRDIIWNKKKVTVERGCFIGSIAKIADFFDLSTGTVSYILDYLISERMVERVSTYTFTYFKIINYDRYQGTERVSESGVKAEKKRSESGMKQNKNIKNDKNVKNKEVIHKKNIGQEGQNRNRIRGIDQLREELKKQGILSPSYGRVERDKKSESIEKEGDVPPHDFTGDTLYEENEE